MLDYFLTIKTSGQQNILKLLLKILFENIIKKRLKTFLKYLQIIFKKMYFEKCFARIIQEVS